MILVEYLEPDVQTTKESYTDKSYSQTPSLAKDTHRIYDINNLPGRYMLNDAGQLSYFSAKDAISKKFEGQIAHGFWHIHLDFSPDQNEWYMAERHLNDSKESRVTLHPNPSDSLSYDKLECAIQNLLLGLDQQYRP